LQDALQAALADLPDSDEEDLDQVPAGGADVDEPDQDQTGTQEDDSVLEDDLGSDHPVGDGADGEGSEQQGL
jgi:hypothetical protein